MLSIAAAGSTFISMIHHEKKLRAIQLINNHDRFLKEHLKVKLNYKIIHKRVMKVYWLFAVTIGLSYFWFLGSAYYFSSMFLIYAVQYFFMGLIIDHENFQFFIFLYAIELRLEVLSKLKFRNDLDDKKMLFNIYTSLVQLQEIVREIDKCFATSLLINYFWHYGSILSNLHWIGLALFGVPYASVAGTTY